MEFLKTAKRYRQFIIYKLVRKENKIDKIPLDAKTGKASLDESSRVTFEEAVLAASRLGNGHGVGFVFTEQDPFWFLDIDKCLIPSFYDENSKFSYDDYLHAGWTDEQLVNNKIVVFKWSSLAYELLNLFPGAAVEISTSGRGLHIFGSGKAQAHSCRNEKLGIEFYTKNRFVALTGISSTGEIGTDHTSALQILVTKYFAPASNTTDSKVWTSESCVEWNGPSDDQELLNRMLRSQSARSVFGGSAAFRDLWDANISVLSITYPRNHNSDSLYNESSADAALAQHLAFWTGNNCERMLRMMTQSKLMREKWNRPDYLHLTILSACAKQTEWLRDKSLSPPIFTAPISDKSEVKKLNRTIKINGATLLTPDQQIQLFEGCNYVSDVHQILVPGGYLLNQERFRAMYGGYSFIMDDQNQRISRNAWEAFTESQVNRKELVIHSSTFRPDKEAGEIIQTGGQNLVNTYWPIDIPRIPGDPTPFLKHLEKILPDSQDQKIILSYIAACVQYKGVKFQWCPVIQGVDGNGKSLLSKIVAHAIGKRYCRFPPASEITAKFNTFMYGTIFVGVEDIHESDASVYEKLKPMITADEQEIEPKGVDRMLRDICCNFIMNTNHKDGLRKYRNDRRLAPFFTAQQDERDLRRDKMTGSYFYNLWDWLINQKGFAIVSDFLYDYKISDELNPGNRRSDRAPITTSTESAIEQGRGGVEQEVLESIEQGHLGFRGGWVSSSALGRLLEKLGASKRITPNKRRALLQSLGYDLHPNLKDGRVTSIVLPDGDKPRLYIQHRHAAREITDCHKIMAAYSEAQK